MKDIVFREKGLSTRVQYFPDAKEVRYPAAGHFLAEEKPDQLICKIAALF